MIPWRVINALLLGILIGLLLSPIRARAATAPEFCMAINLYHEARDQPLDGQFAVAQVTLNRAGRKPERVCDVVRAPKQFSWTISPQGIKEQQAWVVAQTVARLSFFMQDFTGGADHYHLVTIPLPSWTRTMDVAGQWGHHIFYRERKARK